MSKEEKAYEKFKLIWMLNHGFTLHDLIHELDELKNESDFDKNLETLLRDWEFGCGFRSEVWPCFEEFIESDYPLMKKELEIYP